MHASYDNQLIFDPDEGLRIEVLRSIFGLSMPKPCVPKRRGGGRAASAVNETDEIPMCSAEDEFLLVAPSREQYAFVERVLVKLLVARAWAYTQV